MKKIIIIAALLLSAPAFAAIVGPASKIESSISEILTILSKDESRHISADDRESIRNILSSTFDYREMARRAVGKSWKEVGEKRRRRFTILFRDLLESSYASRLNSYTDQKIKFYPAEIKRGKASVKTEILDSERVTPVEYRLYLDKVWRVYDIKIEGVSLVRNFYSDFQPIIKRDGFGGLMSSIEEKLNGL